MLPFLREGLVLEMHFNELVGATTYDLSGYSNHGTIYGASRLSEGFVRALHFDGVDDCVSVSYFPYLSKFTVAAWARCYQVSDIRYQRIIWFGSTDGTPSWNIYITRFSPYSTLFEVSKPDGTGFTLSFAITNPSGWNFYAATFDGSIYRIYLNGMLRTSRSDVAPRIPATPTLRIGCRAPGADYSWITVDEVLIYDRALTEEEIKELYYHGSENKFNITIGLLNNGYADLGNSFVAIVYLKNGTILQFPLILEDSLKRGSYLEKTITVDGYYPSYGLVDKLIVCSNDCQGVCSEVIINNQC